MTDWKRRPKGALRIGLTLGLAVSLAGAAATITECEGIPTPAEDQTKGHLLGQITGTRGEPLAGVEISVNGSRTITGRRGVFRLSNLEPGRHRMEVDHDAYFGRVRYVTLREGRHTSVTLRLLPRGEPLALNAELGGRLRHRNLTLDIPANALVLEGSIGSDRDIDPIRGEVEVFMQPIDVGSHEMRAAPPLMGRGLDGGEVTPLWSLGMASIEIYQGDERVNIRPGASVGLALEVPRGQSPVFPDESTTVDMWVYDREEGLWLQEKAQGRIFVPPRSDQPMRLEARLPHLSTWNWDTALLPEWTNCAEGRVVDHDGVPVPGAEVLVRLNKAVGYVAVGETDDNGGYCAPVFNISMLTYENGRIYRPWGLGDSYSPQTVDLLEDCPASPPTDPGRSYDVACRAALAEACHEDPWCRDGVSTQVQAEVTLQTGPSLDDTTVYRTEVVNFYPTDVNNDDDATDYLWDGGECDADQSGYGSEFEACDEGDSDVILQDLELLTPQCVSFTAWGASTADLQVCDPRSAGGCVAMNGISDVRFDLLPGGDGSSLEFHLGGELVSLRTVGESADGLSLTEHIRAHCADEDGEIAARTCASLPDGADGTPNACVFDIGEVFICPEMDDYEDDDSSSDPRVSADAMSFDATTRVADLCGIRDELSYGFMRDLIRTQADPTPTPGDPIPRDRKNLNRGDRVTLKLGILDRAGDLTRATGRISLDFRDSDGESLAYQRCLDPSNPTCETLSCFDRSDPLCQRIGCFDESDPDCHDLREGYYYLSLDIPSEDPLNEGVLMPEDILETRLKVLERGSDHRYLVNLSRDRCYDPLEYSDPISGTRNNTEADATNPAPLGYVTNSEVYTEFSTIGTGVYAPPTQLWLCDDPDVADRADYYTVQVQGIGSGDSIGGLWSLEVVPGLVEDIGVDVRIEVEVIYSTRAPTPASDDDCDTDRDGYCEIADTLTGRSGWLLGSDTLTPPMSWQFDARLERPVTAKVALLTTPNQGQRLRVPYQIRMLTADNIPCGTSDVGSLEPNNNFDEAGVLSILGNSDCGAGSYPRYDSAELLHTLYTCPYVPPGELDDRHRSDGVDIFELVDLKTDDLLECTTETLHGDSLITMSVVRLGADAEVETLQSSSPVYKSTDTWGFSGGTEAWDLYYQHQPRGDSSRYFLKVDFPNGYYEQYHLRCSRFTWDESVCPGATPAL